MIDDVEGIQFALFLRSPPALSALQLWERAIGGSPLGFDTIAPGNTRARGDVGGTEFNLFVQSSRVDLLIQGAPTPSQVPPMPPAVADPSGALARGLDVAKQVLSQLEVGRTATVIQGHTVATDALDAIALLRKLLPNVLFPESAQEAIYQIVVPRESSVAGRRLKQLCKWQTLVMQLLEVQVGAAQPSQAVNQRFVVHQYADIFSEAVEILDGDRAFEALKEVASIAYEIIRDGYDAVH